MGTDVVGEVWWAGVGGETDSPATLVSGLDGGCELGTFCTKDGVQVQAQAQVQAQVQGTSRTVRV